jgi:hypothetical protein
MTKKHTLTIIGAVGSFRAYLDVPREEAELRYWGDKSDIRGPKVVDSARIRIIEFDDEIGVYDAWEVEPK